MGETNDVIARLQDETRKVLREELVPGEPVALLDFPSHQNAGDSMIYLGERAHLRALQIPVRYICDVDRFDPAKLQELVPEGPLLLHGGGNFGDRYEQFQLFRERIMTKYPHRKIVQLPQSIEYRAPHRATRTASVLNSHPNFTLLLRDSEALATGQELFRGTNIKYCPDMAFGIGHVASRREPTHDVVTLLRTDAESVTPAFELRPESTRLSCDWGLHGIDEAYWRALQLPGRFGRKFPWTRSPLYPLIRPSYDLMAELNVREAIATIGRGRVTVTDRLHATVLACLMDRPVVSLANANGKIRAAFNNYLKEFPKATYAASIAEVRELTESYLK